MGISSCNLNVRIDEDLSLKTGVTACLCMPCAVQSLVVRRKTEVTCLDGRYGKSESQVRVQIVV